jgi:hypothetical protein
LELEKEEMRLIEVYRIKGTNTIIEQDIESVLVWIQNLQVGEKLTVEKTEMTQEEFNSLPEAQEGI